MQNFAFYLVPILTLLSVTMLTKGTFPKIRKLGRVITTITVVSLLIYTKNALVLISYKYHTTPFNYIISVILAERIIKTMELLKSILCDVEISSICMTNKAKLN